MWQNSVGDVMDKNYDLINVILKYLYFKRPRVANFSKS